MNKILPMGLLLALATCVAEGKAEPNNNLPNTVQQISFDKYLNNVGKNNLEYLASKLNVDIAQAEIVASKVLPDPSLDFEAGRETFSLGLSYSVEMGKRHARKRLAKSEYELEKLTLEQGFHELRAQAADLFLEAILQQELLKVKRSSYEYMLQFSQSDSLRFVAGEVNENDARQSRLEAVTLLNDVYDQESAYHASLVELNRFMGANADTLNIPTGDWGNVKRDFTLPYLMDMGMENRVDLMMATKNIEVNRRAYKLARAERRPDIDVSVSYERDWGYYTPEARYVTMGVSIPLAFSTINRGELKSAKYRTNQASLQQKDIELQVQSEIRQSWYAYEAEKKKVEQYKSGVLDESKKVMDGMVYRYKRGEASILDVLIAQRSYNDVCQDYLETMKGFVSSLVVLEKACGIWDLTF